MPSTSKKQHNFMAAIANNPAFAKKTGVPQSVGQDFNNADKGKTFNKGGTMKSVDMEKNPGMAKLPTDVRNKMGYMKKGGMASDAKEDMPMMKKVAKQEVMGHEKKMHGMAKGGVTRADGCVSKGHTKGTMITMKSGGMC